VLKVKRIGAASRLRDQTPLGCAHTSTNAVMGSVLMHSYEFIRTIAYTPLQLLQLNSFFAKLTDADMYM